MSEPKSVTVTIGGDEPETCLHCRLGNAITRMIEEELGGEIEGNDLLGALIANAGQIISQVPSRGDRRLVLHQATELLRKEAQPRGAVPTPGRVH